MQCRWTPLSQVQGYTAPLCREAQLVDISEDTDTSPDSDSLVDSELLAGPDPADEHLDFELVAQQDDHECDSAGEHFHTGRSELPVFVWHSSGVTCRLIRF